MDWPASHKDYPRILSGQSARFEDVFRAYN
jgi:hypothetical protein